MILACGCAGWPIIIAMLAAIVVACIVIALQ